MYVRRMQTCACVRVHVCIDRAHVCICRVYAIIMMRACVRALFCDWASAIRLCVMRLCAHG